MKSPRFTKAYGMPVPVLSLESAHDCLVFREVKVGVRRMNRRIWGATGLHFIVDRGSLRESTQVSRQMLLHQEEPHH